MTRHIYTQSSRRKALRIRHKAADVPPLDEDGRWSCGCHFGVCRNLASTAEDCQLFKPISKG